MGRPGAEEGAEKVGRGEGRRTSGAEAAKQNKTYGTAEAVPLTCNDKKQRRNTGISPLRNGR
jgi:hypothetical protein